MKKLEKVYLILFIICVIGVFIATHNGSPFFDSLVLFIPLVITYPIAWLIRYAIENNKEKNINIIQENNNTQKEDFNNPNSEHQINWLKLIMGLIIFIVGIIIVCNTSFNLTKY